MLVAQTADELVAQWKRAKERGFDTVVQELVPDSEDGIWSLFAYLGRSGRPLATATGVKVRQGPLHFGTSAVFRTTPQPRVRELGLRLLESARLPRASPRSSSPTTGATATTSCSR